jgi:hypothetical protein
MPIGTFRVSGREFVIVPRAGFDRLQKSQPAPKLRKPARHHTPPRPSQAEVDAGDVAEARRRLADPTDALIPYCR